MTASSEVRDEHCSKFQREYYSIKLQRVPFRAMDGDRCKSPAKVTPGFHLSDLKLLCALLSRKEQRRGGKAVKERAPPQHGLLSEFSFRTLGERARAACTKWCYGCHWVSRSRTSFIARLIRKKVHSRVFVHFSMGWRVPSGSGQMANQQHGCGIGVFN